MSDKFKAFNFLFLLPLFSLFFFINTVSKLPYIFYYGKMLNNPVEAVITMGLGLRVVYSEWLYIRLLQYYGEKEEGNNFEFGSGNYPLFYPKAIEIAIINPYLKTSVLNSSSSLAFNLKKTSMAKAVLKFSLLYSNDKDYLILLSAIAIYEAKNKIIDKELIIKLYELAKKDDAPVMFIQLTAFLAKQAKEYKIAIELYSLIIERAKDNYYIENAKKQLKNIKEIV